MGLLNSMISIIGKGVAKSVSEVVEKAVAEAVKPAAEKLAEKQADLLDSVTKNVEAAGDAASQTDPEQIKTAMEFLRQNARTAAEEIKKIEIEEKLTDEEVLAQWDSFAAGYPKWSCGGNHLNLETETSGEEKFTYLYIDTAEANIIAYKAVLIANGFLPKWRSSANQTWYKKVGDHYPAIVIELWDEDNSTYRLALYEESEKEIAEAARS